MTEKGRYRNNEDASFLVLVPLLFFPWAGEAPSFKDPMRTFKFIEVGDIVEKISGSGAGLRGVVLQCDPPSGYLTRAIRLEVDGKHMREVLKIPPLRAKSIAQEMRRGWNRTENFRILERFRRDT